LSKKDKLLKRLKSRPTDFTFDELKTLLEHYGYSLTEAGKTSGSRVSFVKGDSYIRLHKPHPGNILKRYQINDILDVIDEGGN
jgi:hypothetical protein